MIEIIDRIAWGARYPDGAGPAPLPAREVWLHHSATVPPPLGASFALDADAVRTVEAITHQRFGQGMSYTFLVAPSGRVFEGHGIGRVGAHTARRNSTARAICLVGNYMSAQPTAAQQLAVAMLVRDGRAAGWWSTPVLNGGHRDVPDASTLCPGDQAYPLIAEINELALGAAAPVRVGAAALPTLRFGEDRPAVAALQQFAARAYPGYPGIGALPATGYYGAMTKAWVAEFQRRSGVTGADANGEVVGPRTNAALYAAGYRG